MKRMLTIYIGFLLILSGCVFLPVEETLLPPPVFNPPQPVQWFTVPVSRRDVVVPIHMTATYTSTRQEPAFFSVFGVEVEGIFVSVGDEVYEGQLLARLYMPDKVIQLEDALRRQARLEVNIRHVEERHRHSLRRAELTETPFDDTFYLQQRARLWDQMEFLQAEVRYLDEIVNAGYVFAPKAGTVVQALAFNEGMLSTSAAVAIITDTPETVFVLSHIHAADFAPGDILEMRISQGGVEHVVTVEVVDPGTLGFEPAETVVPQAFLEVVDTSIVLEPGTRGRIVHAITAGDVIAAPTRNIQTAEDRHFVFVLENGVRRLRFVEIGLQAANYTEIVSGLEVGELLIR